VIVVVSLEGVAVVVVPPVGVVLVLLLNLRIIVALVHKIIHKKMEASVLVLFAVVGFGF
jgi:hypothetical protein